MKRWRKILLLGAGLVLLLLAGTELIYYFPLTPLSLDLRGETRLPASPAQLSVLMVGDVLLADAARGVIQQQGYAHLFGATRQWIQGADLAVGNLEGPISVSCSRDSGRRWSYRMEAAAAPALRRAGFSLMNLANNHVRDCGDVGLRETVQRLRRAGITPYGAGTTGAQAHAPVLRRLHGVRVGFLGYMTPHMTLDGEKHSMEHHLWAPGRAGAARGSAALVARDIRRLRGRADVVIVSFHMGDRYQREPTDWERRLCRQAIEAGADAVVNHGTHILGPLERHQGRPILHGVGNFAFGSGNIFARFSLAAVLLIDRQRRRLASVQLLPLYTVNHNPWVRFQAKPLSGLQARRVLADLVQRSAAPLALKQDPWRVSLQVHYP